MTIFQRYLSQNPTMGATIPNIVLLTSRLQRIVVIEKRNMAQTQEETPLIKLSEAKRFITDCLQAVGTPKSNADDMGDVLVRADYTGHFSHGMNRLEMYIKDVKSCTCDPAAVPKILKQTAATAWVDGQNGLGAVIGKFCMCVAIQKAKEVGVGLVAVNCSNHFGISTMYTLQAVEEGLLGLDFTNTSPFMAPTRSKKAFFGTNPIALAAPGKGGDHFLLDMATTAVAYGKIEIAKRKRESIPEGWAQDKDGHPTTDTLKALEPGACLMPLGGIESNSGFKGYGLSFLVEIFSGILSGAAYGPSIRKWGTTKVAANLGQSFFAIDPKCFAPCFEDRLSDLMNSIRAAEATDPSKPVLVPGDLEKQNMAAVDKAGGIRYLPSQMKTCQRLSKELNVKPLVGCS